MTIARRLLGFVVCAVLIAASYPGAQAPVVNAVPPDIARILREIRAADKGLLAISEEDGRFLRLLAISQRTQRALEIGSVSGYSAIWIAMGLREPAGAS
jgi:predicted O-methyltransferase YrrM